MKIDNFVEQCLNNCADKFAKIDTVSLYNQQKVVDAFRSNKIALRHFAATSGYGYDDVGRDTLCKLYADVFGAESAIVSPLITSGTHALTVALFGALKCGDTILFVSGEPYDTLSTVINGAAGSLADYGIKSYVVDLLSDGNFNFTDIESAIRKYKPTVVYFQRSRGYEWREAFSVAKLSEAISFVKKLCKCCVMVDNCYGEFVECEEPTNVGADICVGSLIKNIGGGIAPSGGYIVGKSKYIDAIAGRLTAPSVGMEVGSYAFGYREFYQGLFLAPHVTAQALKTATLFCYALSQLGYDVKPAPNETFYDIVCSIKFGDEKKLIDFCQSIQYVSPVDSFATPEPWAMPGYLDKVIMSAGCFVQGASIELSCDAPIRSPYIAYLQGGLTLEHGIIALKEVLRRIVK